LRHRRLCQFTAIAAAAAAAAVDNDVDDDDDDDDVHRCLGMLCVACSVANAFSCCDTVAAASDSMWCLR